MVGWKDGDPGWVTGFGSFFPEPGEIAGMGARQSTAASWRCFTTSAAVGRCVLSLSQQSCTKSHSEFENPIAKASSGFGGRSPSTTDSITSASGKLENGVSPVRT